MPDELIRKAVEDSIRDGLEATGGDWSAFLLDGREIQFRPEQNGLISILLEEEGEEREVKLQVCVKLAE